MTTTDRILRSALLLSVALTVGSTTAALAGGPRVPVVRPPISRLHLPVYPPQPPQQGGVIGGGGGSGALCYDQAPGCHQPY
jgi:hypothetical protein